MKTKIETYIEKMISIMPEGRQKDFYERLSANGVKYTQPDEKVSKASLNYINLKQCFRNSVLMALVLEELEYAEGFYITDVFDLPLEHAWNFNRKTREVADYTSIKFGFVVNERFGVHIPKEILTKYFESKYNGIISPLQYCNIMRIGIFK